MGIMLISAFWLHRPNQSTVIFFSLIISAHLENMGIEPKFTVLRFTVKKLWFFKNHQIRTFSHNAKNHNFLTVNHRTINVGSIPMFLRTAEMIKDMINMKADWFGLGSQNADIRCFSHWKHELTLRPIPRRKPLHEEYKIL